MYTRARIHTQVHTHKVIFEGAKVRYAVEQWVIGILSSGHHQRAGGVEGDVVDATPMWAVGIRQGMRVL